MNEILHQDSSERIIGEDEDTEWAIQSLAQVVKEKTMGDKLQRFFEMTKLTEIRRNEGGWEDFIQSLDSNTAMGYLKRLNGILKEIPIQGRGTVEQTSRGESLRVQVGSLVGPFPEEREKIFANGLESFKNIKDNHARAAMVFYAMTCLHMFADGNGRTSRVLYTLISQPDFDFKDLTWMLEHEEGSNTGEREEFYRRNKLYPPDEGGIERWLTQDVFNHRLANGKIDSMFDKAWLLRASRKRAENIAVTDVMKNELDENERKRAIGVLSDGSGNTISVAGISIAQLLTEKGAADEAESSIYGDGERVRFDVDWTEGGSPVHASWNAKDFRRLIQIGGEIKEDVFSDLFDIFEHEERHMLDEKTTLAEAFKNFDGTIINENRINESYAQHRYKSSE